MKPRLLALMCLLLLSTAVLADEDKTADAAATLAATPGASATPGDWKKQVIASLNLNQASFSNWAQGGTNMVSGQVGLNARFEEDNSEINWLNILKLQYGLTYMANQGTQVSADTIDLESTYSWKTWPQVNPYLSFTAQSQFGPGYNYSVSPSVEISDFLDPGYFTESAGLKYTPAAFFYTRAGLGLKETVADQFKVPYTVDPNTGQAAGELTQLGLDWVSELNVKFLENSNFGSKLDAFWPGGNLDLTVMEWDNLLSFTLNRLFSLNVEYDFRYDSRVFNGIQIKETLGLGFNYSLL